MVASVDPAGTAADSGIQKDDIIVEVQQTSISEPDGAERSARSRARDDVSTPDLTSRIIC
jgi:S1-C subfamily serine protease